jgi:hypothetical protein
MIDPVGLLALLIVGWLAAALARLVWWMWGRGEGEVIKFIHTLILWYLARCGGAFHTNPYGQAGRYVVAMSDEQYHYYKELAEKITPVEFHGMVWKLREKSDVTTVWQDGTYKTWNARDAQYAAQDPDWLVNIAGGEA